MALTAEWTEEAFGGLFQVDLKGTWPRMRAEIGLVLAQRSDPIVDAPSRAGLTGRRTTASYAASRHGIVGLTRTVAVEHPPST